MKRKQMSFWDVWNMSFGFLGIQFGFALQNANASRILQTFGADMEHLSWFWLAAPLTGMIIQPIVGHYSDRTWTRLGRRRPYFLVGAVLTAIALVLMPNSAMFTSIAPSMFVGAGMLMIMDASINITMEPFRALVADLLPSEQRTLGFSMQTALIGIGAFLGSWFPYVLAEWFGISKVAAEGQVPDNVIFSFYAGAIVLLATIIWTVVKTKEYPDEVMASDIADDVDVEPEEKQSFFTSIAEDIREMPKTMKQLGLVQFFSWFALFSMWVFTTPAVAVHVYGADINDTSSQLYQDAGNWVGIIFGVYNVVSAIYAFFFLPKLAGYFGRKNIHAFSLAMGGLSFISMFFIKTPVLLLFPMVGIGIAWGSILAMPYAILAGSLPVKKMGVYMGLFNFFITLPQIVNGVFGGPMVKRLFDSQAIYALVLAGILMLVAAMVVRFVDDKDDMYKLKVKSKKLSY